MADPVTLAVLPKSADLETHVRLVRIGDRRILELVDFIPSLSEYGRGYWVSVTDNFVLDDLAAALDRVRSAD